jgi:ubiquinone/menaquinone biosynthesis C-methylase UbiE
MQKDGNLTSDPRIGFFDGLAEQWDVSGQSPAETVETIKRHAHRLRLAPGNCVLEVGCGTGQLTGWLADQVRPGKVVGVDFSREMLRLAKAKGIAATFLHADVCKDVPGNTEFDLALCFHSFPHFRDQSAALRNLARALKPRGRLIVMHLHPRHEVNAFHHGVGGTVMHDFLPDDSQFGVWLDAAGFEKPDIRDDEDGFMLETLLRC